MLCWDFRPTLRVIYIFCGGVFSSIILNIQIFNGLSRYQSVLFFTANYIESLPIAYNCFLLADTLCQLSHLLDGLKTNLSHWFYFSFAVAFSQQATE